MFMALKIYTVTDSKGARSLVRAHTAAGALKFKREQIVMRAAVTTQDELIEMAGKVPVESAADSVQADIEDSQKK
jgi:hypothetical protein